MPPRVLKFKELTRLLEGLGLYLERQSGSHQTWRHPDIPEPLTGVVWRGSEVKTPQWLRVRKWLARHQLLEEQN